MAVTLLYFDEFGKRAWLSNILKLLSHR